MPSSRLSSWLVAALQLLGDRAHHRALERPRTAHRLVDERARGDAGDLLGERQGARRQQLEQLAQAHEGVERRQELAGRCSRRRCAPAKTTSAAVDASVRAGSETLVRSIVDAEGLGDLLGQARHRERQGDLLAAAAAWRHEAYEQQQGLLERHLVADARRPGRAARAPGSMTAPEIGAHDVDQALHVGDVDAELGGGHGRLLLVGEGVQRETSAFR